MKSPDHQRYDELAVGFAPVRSPVQQLPTMLWAGAVQSPPEQIAELLDRDI